MCALIKCCNLKNTRYVCGKIVCVCVRGGGGGYVSSLMDRGGRE